MKHTDEHLRYVEVLIHVIGWGIVFGFPLLMMNRSGMGITWADYLRHGCVVPLSFLVVFYVNYFALIPRYLFAGRMRTYIIYNVLLVAVVLLGGYVWQELAFLLDEPRPPRHIGPPRWVFVARDAFSMVLTVGLCAAIRLSRRWAQTEEARREAEKSRAEAELKNLRNQLNPHFLRPHRLRRGQGTGRRAGAEPTAAPRPLREPAAHRQPGQGDGLYP